MPSKDDLDTKDFASEFPLTWSGLMLLDVRLVRRFSGLLLFMFVPPVVVCIVGYLLSWSASILVCAWIGFGGLGFDIGIINYLLQPACRQRLSMRLRIELILLAILYPVLSFVMVRDFLWYPDF